MFRRLRPPPGSTITFLVLISFLGWFIAARLFTYFLPETVITVRGVHVHHFAYGIIMLSLLSFVSIAYPLSKTARMRLAPLLGIALASAYDEFAMWLLLDDLLHDRRNYDAIVVIALVMLNAIYFPGFWSRWGHRLWKLLNILLLGLPSRIAKRLTRTVS
jgi:hypothetical protein